MFWSNLNPAGLRVYAFSRSRRSSADFLAAPVDLNTAEDLSIYYRDKILAEAEPLYVAA
jgi:hypothetical protein